MPTHIPTPKRIGAFTTTFGIASILVNAVSLGFPQFVQAAAPAVAGIALLALCVTIFTHRTEWVEYVREVHRRGRLIALILTIVSGLIFMGSLWWLALPTSEEEATAASPAEKPVEQEPPPSAVPNPAEIAPLVSVDGVRGEDLVGNIIIRNGSSHTITLLASRYDTFGGLIQTSQVPLTIPAYQTLPIILEDGNKLVKTGSLGIRYDFKFLGSEETHKVDARFVIPETPRIGTQIGPNECCEAGDAPLLSDGTNVVHDLLLQPRGHVGFKVEDKDGVQQHGMAPFQVIRFDPENRGVVFLSGPPGPKQIVLTSGMARNPKGEHWIQAAWNVDKDQYAMSVDGRPARRNGAADGGR